MSNPSLTSAALQALQAIYQEADIIWGEQAALMAVDESHAVVPNPLCVLTPKTHEQVLNTINWALDFRVSIVPSGGRTGLSGGACAGYGEVVLSLSKMNHVLAFDVDSGLITVEAGVALEYLQNTVAGQGWFYPVDYASRGSAQMGGAVATNAGGIRVLRYGMTRDWVVGLKAVTGSGQTLCISRHLEKDNAGYDLKNLIIGSEGTLAVITEITFKLARPMREQTTLLIGIEDMQSLLAVFLLLRKATDLNAAEFFCQNALAQVMAVHQLQSPFADNHAFYLLVEFDKNTITEEHLGELLGNYEVLISQSFEQTRKLWRYRELISSSINPLRPYKNDVACSLSKFRNWFSALEHGFLAINADVQFIWFGHLGDGNVHINVIKPQTMTNESFNNLAPLFSRLIADVTLQYGATASAEHGIGLLKIGLLFSSRAEQEIAIMRQIKAIFDPQGILNPFKLF